MNLNTQMHAKNAALRVEDKYSQLRLLQVFGHTEESISIKRSEVFERPKEYSKQFKWKRFTSQIQVIVPVSK